MNGNYIKINRSILEWGWYSDINTRILFIHFLLKANWKEGNFKGVNIERGSFVSSVNKLSVETGLTEREVRTAISHLKSTGEVTSKSYPKFTVFTVKNYGLHQTSDKQNDEQVTSKRQASDKQATTIEERKKERRKEINNNNMRFCPPTVEEVRAYCLERNNKVDAQAFVDFYTSKNWMVGKNKMSDWKASVRTWERQTRQEGTAKRGNRFNNFEGRDIDMNSLEQQLLNAEWEEV